MRKPVIVIGGGGHARVLISTILLEGRTVLGFTDPDEKNVKVMGVERLGDDGEILRYRVDEVCLVNGIGFLKSASPRKQIYERFRQQGYEFESVVHPSAVIAPDVEIADGVQIMAGAVVQCGSRLGANSIVNTRAGLDHDCEIGPHAHIAPGVTLSGEVHVGEGACIGTGASIIQGVVIGANSFVGAGAVVLQDVLPGATVMGVPARVVTRKGPLE
jgi:UDP-perosamine 4-acetyltransferase